MAETRLARYGGIRLLVVVALGGMPWAAPAHAQDQSFTMRNASPVAVESVYVSPIYSNYWGSDRLNRTLQPGQAHRIEMKGYGRNCFFDIRVEDVNGQLHEMWGEDLCNSRFLEVR